MPNLYRRPNSPFWWICGSCGRKLIRRSTGIRHRGKEEVPSRAQEILDAFEVECFQRRIGGISPVPAKDWFASWLSKRQVRKTTRRRYEFVLDHFIAWAGNRTTAQISPIDVADYVETRERQGVCGSTIKIELSLLRAAWQEARRASRCSFQDNPWASVRVKRQPKPERRAFTRQELGRLFWITEPKWLPRAIRIAAYTGARGNSIRGLKWGDVDFEGGTIRFQISKTTPYTVPMHQELAEYLRPLACGPDTPVLGGRVASEWTDYYLPKVFKAAAKDVGVDGTFHQLRHTFISLLAQSGVPERITRALANHNSARVHAQYEHHDAQSLAPELAKLRV